jgi:hypothetical protein
MRRKAGSFMVGGVQQGFRFKSFLKPWGYFDGRDDESDRGDDELLRRNVGGHADPEIVAVVAFGGGVDDGGAVHVGGDDGAGDFGGEAICVDAGAVEDPGVEVGRGFAFVDVLDEVGEGDVLGLSAFFPFDADGEAVGSGSFGLGVFVPVRAFFLGVEFVEDAKGGRLIIGEQKSELDLNGLHRGLQDGLVELLAGVVAEGVLNGQLLMQDAAGDAQLACGGGDLDAIEIKHAGRDLFEELLRGFELLLGVRFGRSSILCPHVHEGEESQEGDSEWTYHG